MKNYTPADLLSALRNAPCLLAAVIGPDGLPMAKNVSVRYEEDGALYFDAAKDTLFYGGLSMHPVFRLYAKDGDGTLLRLTAKAVFTEDAAIRDKCFAASPALGERYADNPKRFIAFFLASATAEIIPEGSEEPAAVLTLPDPESAPLGIRIKKSTELRDRIAKVLVRREEEGFHADTAEEVTLAKLFDGALFVFAEAAKELWPRMDIRPIERAAVYETYDEREKYTALAASLIGNARIDKPEDVTYWLNRETLGELATKRGLL